MKHLEKYKSFNENHSEKNPILAEIINKLSDKLGENLTDLYFSDILSPSVYFVLKGRPFTISLTDRKGMTGEYSTIIVIVEIEDNGITESLGYFSPYEIDEVVDLIFHY